MATTTVTFAADEDLVRSAEKIASQNQTDLPSMIKRYLSALIMTQEPLDEAKLPPITRSAIGLFKGIPDKSYKELLTEALVEKYGWKE
jgi:hypothetical protein